jgi:hypothetical protein
MSSPKNQQQETAYTEKIPKEKIIGARRQTTSMYGHMSSVERPKGPNTLTAKEIRK